MAKAASKRETGDKAKSPTTTKASSAAGAAGTTVAADAADAAGVARVAGKKLVVVESPAKAKTINRYLGSDYIVKASMGHVRDLPTRNPKGVKSPVPGVDLEHDFAPTYEPLVGRVKVLAELRKLAKAAPEILLATDLDREGEAIAWHLAESLGVPRDRMRRVTFNEITKAAIREAFAHPRDLNMNMVNAQQARRILDRLVGYQVSPLLWRKVAAGLSAGRVQSVAVRLIVERERGIDAFQPEEFWRITSVFTPDLADGAKLGADFTALLAHKDAKGNPPTRDTQAEFLSGRGAFRGELVKWKGEKFEPSQADQAIEVARAIGLDVQAVDRIEDPAGKGVARNLVNVVGRLSQKPPKFIVQNLVQRQSKSRPPAPFTTASMQAGASVRLFFSASRTMRVAQQLYEGVELASEGSVGLITYMRTDSVNLSREAVQSVREFINQQFGQQYLPEKPNVYTSAERAQEAHEAIRPTDARRTPADLRGALSEEQWKLYDLIWRRFVACQMTPAVSNIAEADIVAATAAGDALFKAVGRQIAFDGFYRVAGLPRTTEQVLPELATGQEVAAATLDPSQHFTQPPPRYTEASLVKALEADGIGRPSTYAAIIETIQKRQYVEHIERTLRPTALGNVVTDKLVQHFPDVFDVRFTAQMEDKLDLVEDEGKDWIGILKDFYGPFAKALETAQTEMVHARAETTPSEYVCDACGKPMVYRLNRRGERFLSCSAYPDCKAACAVDKEGKRVVQVLTQIACPLCGKPMTLRRGRFGPFLSCSTYPDCKGIIKLDRKGLVKLPAAPPLTVELTCPKCQSPLYLRRGKRGPWMSCSKYPKCRGRLAWTTLTDDQRKELELKLLNHEKANPIPTLLKLDGSPVGGAYDPLKANAPQGDESPAAEPMEE